MTEYAKTDINQVRRLPKRADYDRETVQAIVDASAICHVGFVVEGRPFVVPTIHARIGEVVYFHGAPASRMLKTIRDGASLCITVTHLDGLVLARSAFHHSMNYRSAMLFGIGRLVDDETEKWDALHAITEAVMPGRWEDARQPNPKEMAATLVVAMPIEYASAKVRTGPPGDDEEDYALPVWAGVLPLALTPQAPIDDPLLSPGIPVPAYILNF
ncbi:MAG: pyridoxamine 5'-phosphate oxidase family protein [Caldilineaceae bacterium]|nr:pyridoxamine 5'-phosphate oxidase family protein [Caldilineaceae bacterium]MBP8107921.1 pyridoxamine 5'-phosphate oxidase family protein [Caldilineaceae bacterium]MBP9073294.1 pyridoxamine 5'-phosphate oxidase family protein [Caldilineaceae bacterium]